MHPSEELLEQLTKEDIEQARAMPPSQKLRAGGDLFDEACRWTLAGIRHQHPGISEADAFAELQRRIDRSAAREEGW